MGKSKLFDNQNKRLEYKKRTTKFKACLLIRYKWKFRSALFIASFMIHKLFLINIKGSSDPSHFIFEFNVGKSRIRHTTTLKLNDEFPDRLQCVWRLCHFKFRVVLCRIHLFPTLISKIKWLGSEPPLTVRIGPRGYIDVANGC